MKVLGPKVFMCEYCSKVLKTEEGMFRHEDSCDKNTAKAERISKYFSALEDIRLTSTTIHEVISRVQDLWLSIGVKVTFSSYPSKFDKNISNSSAAPIGYERNWNRSPDLPSGYPGWSGRWNGKVEVLDAKLAGVSYIHFRDLCSGSVFPRGNIPGGAPYLHSDTGGGGMDSFAYSGMMFIYDFPKIHQEFINNGGEYEVLEEEYNRSVDSFYKVFKNKQRDYVNNDQRKSAITRTIAEITDCLTELNNANIAITNTLSDEFAKTFTTELPKPIPVFADDESVMQAVCGTQAPDKIVHPEMKKLFERVERLAIQIGKYKAENPELFI